MVDGGLKVSISPQVADTKEQAPSLILEVNAERISRVGKGKRKDVVFLIDVERIPAKV